VSSGRWRRGRVVLVVSAAWVAGMVYGYQVHREHWPPYEAGLALYRWALGGGSTASGEPPSGSRAPLTAAQKERMEQLEALGYVTGVTLGPPGKGVTVYERDSAFAGVNLYSSLHRPAAVLIDMAGKVLHEWTCRYEDAFAGFPPPRNSTGQAYYRRVHLYPNGDLLAIFEGLGIIRLDRTGALRWAVHDGAHHDVDVGPDGTIYVLARAPRIVEQIDPTEPILEDFIDVLSPQGRRLDRISILDAVRSSDFAALMSGSPEVGDVFHTNSIRLLDGRLAARVPAFARGCFLVSLRNRDTIAVIDPRTRRVVWALRGLTMQQHDASLLDTGHLLVFDNRNGKTGSRVIEVDPSTERIVWRYPGVQTPSVFSARFGTAQRLPNGNTLTTFSEMGTALEVTPDRRIVWRFDSPHRTGVGDAFIATLEEVRRYRWEYVSSWLPETR
jgi:hypothetical protein